MWLRKGPVIAALYPVGMLLLQLSIAIFLSYLVATALLTAVNFLLDFTGWQPDWLAPFIRWPVILVVSLFVLRWFKARDGKFFAYYLMHDYAYSARWRGANPPALEARMAEFRAAIADALTLGYDEVLVVGHSSGAHLGVSILADLLRARRARPGATALSFLSLGQVVPMVSFLPDASRLRADLAFLSERTDITWIDVTAPGDGCAFALCDPVAVTGVATPFSQWPLVVSAAFTRTLKPETWAKLRWRFFRLHFQYLCAFDNLPGGPSDYDYFRLTAGPQTLGTRYRDRAPSRSRIDVAASKYTSRAAPRPWRRSGTPPDPASAAGSRGAVRIRRGGGQGRCQGIRDRPACVTLPPKPPVRPDAVSLRRYLKLFRDDILSAQPARLYRAWMAEFRTPFFRSYLVNDPTLIRRVLNERPDDFPKSDRIGAGLRPLLGNSVFLTNGETWKRQRRIIDPAFEGGRLRDTFPAMWAAGQAAVARMAAQVTDDPLEIEPETSHAAADVIFRTLFSLPIEHDTARAVFDAFRAHQRTQPILNLAAFLPGPRWMPRFFRRETLRTAVTIRGLISGLVEVRAELIAAGTAPDDLATKIMTNVDPVTGERLSPEEMVDQVAIFFLAGHETSASALAWTLYLLAMYPEWQVKIAEEAVGLNEDFGAVAKLRVTRDVFREALRLYPPVPMMVRETTRSEVFRDRNVRRGAQVVLSPWHLHRHERIWEDPDAFRPGRWQTEAGRASAREAYLPFSAGPRVCTGAGFAMIEGVLLLALLVRAFRFEVPREAAPVPVAHLTVRSRDGIRLIVRPR